MKAKILGIVGYLIKKGRTIHSLFKKLNLPKDKFEKLGKLIERTKYRNNSNNKKQLEEAIQLPEAYKPLWLERKSPDYRNAMYYLKKRGISIFDIIRYRIGYAESGPYSGKIIIPRKEYVMLLLDYRKNWIRFDFCLI